MSILDFSDFSDFSNFSDFFFPPHKSALLSRITQSLTWIL